MVLAFKWMLFGDYLFSIISQNEVWNTCLILTLTTSWIEKVKTYRNVINIKLKELCHEIQPNEEITKCPLNLETHKNNRLKL